MQLMLCSEGGSWVILCTDELLSLNSPEEYCHGECDSNKSWNVLITYYSHNHCWFWWVKKRLFARSSGMGPISVPRNICHPLCCIWTQHAFIYPILSLVLYRSSLSDMSGQTRVELNTLFSAESHPGSHKGFGWISLCFISCLFGCSSGPDSLQRCGWCLWSPLWLTQDYLTWNWWNTESHNLHGLCSEGFLFSSVGFWLLMPVCCCASKVVMISTEGSWEMSQPQIK